jgi:hypothetical protein
MIVFERRSKLLCLLVVVLTLASCAAAGAPTQTLVVDQLGYFEYSAPQREMKGIVIGAPHGGRAPGAAMMARWISHRTGAGFVAAYGFKSKQVSVEQPLVRSYPHQPVPQNSLKRRSVFSELKQILRGMTDGEIDLYVGLRPRRSDEATQGIEVVASGFTFEETQFIDRTYQEIRDRLIGATAIDKLSLLFAPVDQVSLGSAGIKHHGVLMIAEKGLSLRIPENLLSGRDLSLYGQVFSEWIKKLERFIHDDLQRMPQVQVKLMDLGRFDVIPSRIGLAGVVIGAPHGTYDEYTAEIVKRLAFRTGLAAVIARGFTPTEAGGWRINVNRPTEKTFLAPEFEVSTSRSQEAFNGFRNLVLDAAGGDIRLYVDVHQYGRDSTIQIATVGINAAQARSIKQGYQIIRDRLLKVNPDIERVELLIEPLDEVEIGAWAAKANGILSIAEKSLHIELPLHSALRSEKSRALYTNVISEFIKQSIRQLSTELSN